MQSSSWISSQLPQPPPTRRASPVRWALLAGVIVAAIVATFSAFGQGNGLICIAPFLSVLALVGIMVATRGPGNRAGQGIVAGLLLGLFLSAGLFVGTFLYSFTPHYATAAQNFQATQTVSAQQTAVVATPSPAITNSTTFSTNTAPLAVSFYLGDGLCGLGNILLLAAVGAIIGGMTMGRRVSADGLPLSTQPDPAMATMDTAMDRPSPSVLFPAPFANAASPSNSSVIASDLAGPSLFTAQATQTMIPSMRPFLGSNGASFQIGLWFFFVIIFFALHVNVGIIVWGGAALIAGLAEMARLQRFLAQSETALGYLDTVAPMQTPLRFVSGRVVTFTTNDGQTWQLPLIRRQSADGPLPIRYRLTPVPTALLENGGRKWSGISWRIALGLVSVGLGMWLLSLQPLFLPY